MNNIRIYSNKQGEPIEDFLLAAELFAKNIGYGIELVLRMEEADVIVVDSESQVDEVSNVNANIAVIRCVASKRHPPNVFFIDDCGKIKRLIQYVKRRLEAMQTVV